MSLQPWPDKPWMTPTRYTSDVDPTLQQSTANFAVPRDPDEVEALIRGESLRDERPPTEFGDSRPDPGRVDNTPMIYRQAAYDREPELDLSNDQDFVDHEAPPPQYQPAPKIQPQVRSFLECTIGSAPEPTISKPRTLIISLMGLHPSYYAPTEVTLGVNGEPFRISLEELEEHLSNLRNWREAARAVKL